MMDVEEGQQINPSAYRRLSRMLLQTDDERAGRILDASEQFARQAIPPIERETDADTAAEKSYEKKDLHLSYLLD
jgi:hypothetical protein